MNGAAPHSCMESLRSTLQTFVRSVDQTMWPLQVATRSPARSGVSVRNLSRRAVNLRRALLAAMTVAIVHAAPDPAGRDCPVETRLCPSTLVTTSTVSLPWTKNFVRTRETAIGNLVADSMGGFLKMRCEPAPGCYA